MGLKSIAEQQKINFAKKWVEKERTTAHLQPDEQVSFQRLHEANIYFIYKLQSSALSGDQVAQESLVLANNLHNMLQFWDADYYDKHGVSGLGKIGLKLQNQTIPSLFKVLESREQAHNEITDLIYHYTNFLLSENLFDFIRSKTFVFGDVKQQVTDAVTRIQEIALSKRRGVQQTFDDFQFGVSIDDLLRKEEQEFKLRIEQKRALREQQDDLFGLLEDFKGEALTAVDKHEKNKLDTTRLSNIQQADTYNTLLAQSDKENELASKVRTAISVAKIETIVNEANALPSGEMLTFASQNLDWKGLTFDQLKMLDKQINDAQAVFEIELERLQGVIDDAKGISQQTPQVADLSDAGSSIQSAVPSDTESSEPANVAPVKVSPAQMDEDEAEDESEDDLLGSPLSASKQAIVDTPVAEHVAVTQGEAQAVSTDDSTDTTAADDETVDNPLALVPIDADQTGSVDVKLTRQNSSSGWWGWAKQKFAGKEAEAVCAEESEPTIETLADPDAKEISVQQKIATQATEADIDSANAQALVVATEKVDQPVHAPNADEENTQTSTGWFSYLTSGFTNAGSADSANDAENSVNNKPVTPVRLAEEDLFDSVENKKTKLDLASSIIESLIRKACDITEKELLDFEKKVSDEALRRYHEHKPVQELPLADQPKSWIEKYNDFTAYMVVKFFGPMLMLNSSRHFLSTKFQHEFKDLNKENKSLSQASNVPLKQQQLAQQTNSHKNVDFGYMFNPLAKPDPKLIDEQRIVGKNEKPYLLHQNASPLTPLGEMHPLDKMIMSPVSRFIFGYTTLTHSWKVLLPSYHMLLHPELAARRQEHLGLLHYLTNQALPLAMGAGILHIKINEQKKKAELQGNNHLRRLMEVCDKAWWLIRGPLIGLSVTVGFLLAGAIIVGVIAILAAVVLTALALVAATVLVSSPVLLFGALYNMWKTAAPQIVDAAKMSDTHVKDQSGRVEKLTAPQRGFFNQPAQLNEQQQRREEVQPLLGNYSDEEDSSELEAESVSGPINRPFAQAVGVGVD